MKKENHANAANQPDNTQERCRVIQDRNEWNRLIAEQPAERAELLQELTRFSELWEYFERQNRSLPRDIVDDMRGFEEMTAPQRTLAFREINRRLMERLPNASESSKSRM